MPLIVDGALVCWIDPAAFSYLPFAQLKWIFTCLAQAPDPIFMAGFE